MFPFDYVPDTIDPVLRKIIICLITVQVLAFFIYIIMLIADHKKAKANAENITDNDETKTEDDNVKTNSESKDKIKAD